MSCFRWLFACFHLATLVCFPDKLLAGTLQTVHVGEMANSLPTENPPPLSVEHLKSCKNQPISDSEGLIARRFLLDAEAELGRIDENIRCLELRRNALSDDIQVYRIALAPHKVLPVDVLREIFLSAALSGSQSISRSGFKSDRATYERGPAGYPASYLSGLFALAIRRT
ncbi:hypothetical protein FB451DRAFT_1177142 [Mycena latifolia]|nr:hypothetical protein FB451DRAFT_1177142 [Mycena latifolia]